MKRPKNTMIHVEPIDIEKELDKAIQIGYDEMHYHNQDYERYNESLQKLLAHDSSAVSRLIKKRIDSDKFHLDLATIALEQIGLCEDVSSKKERIEILCAAMLATTSPRMRYGALIGLIQINDKSCLPAVREVASREKFPMLIGIFNQAIECLEKEKC